MLYNLPNISSCVQTSSPGHMQTFETMVTTESIRKAPRLIEFFAINYQILNFQRETPEGLQ